MPEYKTKDNDTCILHTERIHALELSMVEIKGDVKHIRERIDNGLSATVTKVWDKLNEMTVNRVKLETLVEGNVSFLDKIKSAFIWVSVTSVFGGIIALVWKLVHTYIQSAT